MNPDERKPPVAAFEVVPKSGNRKTLFDTKLRNKPHYCKSLAVKLLEEMANNAARLKYPTIPYLAPRAFRDDTANSLTNCIIQFLRLKGWQAERINSTGRRVDTRTTFEDVTGRSRTIGGSHWIKGTGTHGTADISSTIAGKSVKIEVKIGQDFQSQVQKEYQRSIELAGGLYVIAKDFAGFHEWYTLTFGEDQL